LLYSNTNNPETITLAQTLIGEMIQNPQLTLDGFASTKSPANIDLSKVTPISPSEENYSQKVRFMCIYNKLMEAPMFKNLFINTFQNNVRPNVTFEISNLQGTRMGETECPDNNRFNNTIRIDPDLLSNSNNNMIIVKTIIHECIHAFLNVKLADSSIGIPIPTLNDTEVADALNYYCNFTFDQDQHDFMISYMLPTLQTILFEVKNLLVAASDSNYISNNISILQPVATSPADWGSSMPWDWNKYYKFLSLRGLEKSNFFRSEIAELSPLIIIDPIEYFLYNQYNSNGSNDITRTCTN
jgi:hypothetical protein